MWRRVELRNFRSIEHVKVDLAPFTLLVGPNGSGKSNFVDALVFVRDVATDAAAAVERRGGIKTIRRFLPKDAPRVFLDVRAAYSKPGLDTDFVEHRLALHSSRKGDWFIGEERIVIVSGAEAVFDVERSGENMRLHHDKYAKPGEPLRLSLLMLSETASAMVVAKQMSALARNRSLREVRRLRLDPESMRNLQPASTEKKLTDAGLNIATAFKSLSSEGQKEVLAAMGKLIPGLRAILVEQVDRYLLLKFVQEQGSGQEAIFSASSMSDGALRALGILVAAQQMTKYELLIIEEPEVGIHLGAAQLLFEVLKRASKKGSVLVTTHSADLLDAAKDEEILVCSYQDGTTKIGPLASEQRAVVKEGLFSVAELMRSEPLRIEGEPIPAVES